jgi:hypothetical protein
MIRQQQQQILTLQTQNAHSSTSAVAIDDSTPTSERSMSLNHGLPNPASQQPNTSSTSSTAPRPRSPFVSHSLSRHSSYRSSRDGSPSLRPISGFGGSHIDSSDLILGQSATRDESAFYQAETQTLTRENQMLKMRIRELGEYLCHHPKTTSLTRTTERQLNPTYPATHSPATTSNLVLESTSFQNNGESTSAEHASASQEANVSL